MLPGCSTVGNVVISLGATCLEQLFGSAEVVF